jgi:tetratricopeptide (TPR) repeat protein
MSAPSPYFAQALPLFRNGAYPQAIGLLQKAVADQPLHFESRLQLAKACLDWVQMLARLPLTDIEPEKLDSEAAHYLQLAESQLQSLTKMQPASPHLQGMLAMVHLIYARPAEALRCLKKALAKEPRNPDVLYNMGYSLMELENYTEAEKQFRRLVTFYPDHGMGWHMLGEACRLSNRFEASLPAYNKAVGLLRGRHQPYGALAHALKRLGRYDEAADLLRKGLETHPEVRDLNFMHASLSLSIGDWATGWRYYASRDRGTFRPPFPEGHVIPLRAGQPVRVHCDQGLGDELFFLRFLPVLTSRGMTVHYTTQPKLQPLLQGMPEISELAVMETSQPQDYDVLVGDLPYLAGMRSTLDIPPSLALPLDSERAERLRGELARFGPGPYLGVTWQGGTVKTKWAKGFGGPCTRKFPLPSWGNCCGTGQAR